MLLLLELSYKLEDFFKSNLQNELHSWNKYMDIQDHDAKRHNMGYNYPVDSLVNKLYFKLFSYSFYILLKREKLLCHLGAANLERI